MTNYNEQQLQAINFYKGACGVVASAGSGKSTVLVERIKTLVEKHKVDEEDILAISFTNKTAKELEAKLSKKGLNFVNVGTFHAVCLRIMLKEGVDVRGKLVPEWKAENWFKTIDKKPDMQDILGFIGYQKNYMRKPEDQFVYKDSNYDEETLRQFYRVYESNKKYEGLYDFDDYMLLTLDILRKNKGKYTWEFVLVDEHQDSNLIQQELLKEICTSGNMFVVGDAKQAIYGFRAGNLEYFMNFEEYWKGATIINMFMNYRSTNNVVEMSNNFIRPYFKGYAHYVDSKSFNENDGEIELLTFDNDVSEAIEVVERIDKMIKSGTDPDDIAVLYRLNAQSMYIETELKNKGIEYDITNNSSFFKRREVDAIINYLRLIHNPHDDGAMENIFKFRANPLKFFSNALFDSVRRNSGANNISLYESLITYNFEKPWQNNSASNFEKSINRLRLQHDKGVSVSVLIDNIVKLFDIEDNIQEKYSNQEEVDERIKSIAILKSFVKNNNLEQFITYVYSTNTKKKSRKNAVKLMTIHASKGLEWDNVFLVGVSDGVFPHELSEVDEEARLFYVGATRARKNFYVSQIGKDNKFIKGYFM